MTPTQLAEKIHALISEYGNAWHTDPDEANKAFRNDLESLLTEALDEASIEGMEEARLVLEPKITEALAEAKLDALHIGGDRHMCEEALKRSKAQAMFDNTVGDDDTDRRIKEAKASGYQEGLKTRLWPNVADMVDDYERKIKQAKSEAYEDAAKIADEAITPEEAARADGKTSVIAMKIRLRASELNHEI